MRDDEVQKCPNVWRSADVFPCDDPSLAHRLLERREAGDDFRVRGDGRFRQDRNASPNPDIAGESFKADAAQIAFADEVMKPLEGDSLRQLSFRADDAMSRQILERRGHAELLRIGLAAARLPEDLSHLSDDQTGIVRARSRPERDIGGPRGHVLERHAGDGFDDDAGMQSHERNYRRHDGRIASIGGERETDPS